MSSSNPNKLDEKLDELAQKIVDDALGEDVSMTHRIDALKIVSAYHGRVIKANKSDDDDAENVSPLADFTKRLKEAE